VSSYVHIDARTGIKWTLREFKLDGVTVHAHINDGGDVVVASTLVTTDDRSLPEWVYAACERKIEEQVREASRG
jgi:hypothetical protein